MIFLLHSAIHCCPFAFQLSANCHVSVFAQRSRESVFPIEACEAADELLNIIITILGSIFLIAASIPQTFTFGTADGIGESRRNLVLRSIRLFRYSFASQSERTFY